MDLKKVSKGFVVHLPDDLNVSNDGIWMREGTVIDFEDEFLRYCVTGQEYKFEAAPEGAKQTTIANPRILAFKEDWERKRGLRPAPKTRVEKAADAVADAAEPVLAGGIQKPDEVKRRTGVK